MTTKNTEQPTVYCDFCGKSEHDVHKVIASATNVHICSECVAACISVLLEVPRKEPFTSKEGA